MRPGLTGLWQVSARSDPNLESRVRCDLAYVNRWSLMLDAKILVKTIPVVVLGQGGKVRHAGQMVTSPSRAVLRAIESNGSNGAVHHDLSGNGTPRPIEAWASPSSTE
jgi:hypothetical protein